MIMRLGNLDVPAGLLVMPAFALVIAVLLLWSWHYHSRQKTEMQLLAKSRGWRFLGRDAPELRRSLDEVDAGEDRGRDWKAENIISVESFPERVYLFTYQATGPTDEASTEFGTGCLAERPSGQAGERVLIDRRPRLLDRLVEMLNEDGVAVGGPEFQRSFMVWSHRPDVAEAIVTTGVQEVLLRRASGLKWNRVWLADRRVLVTVTLRLKPEDWDELLSLSRSLLEALP